VWVIRRLCDPVVRLGSKAEKKGLEPGSDFALNASQRLIFRFDWSRRKIATQGERAKLRLARAQSEV
jgi:hypothetical protein